MIPRIAVAAIAVTATLGFAAAPADAQRRQRVVEAVGEDKCPDGSNDEIVVCARKPESDRYRIPTEFRAPTPGDAVSQVSRVEEMVAVGRTGTDSCSAVGPGGFTGCFQQQVQQGRAEQREVRRRRTEQPR